MADSKPFKENVVLTIAAENVQRETVAKALRADGYEVGFTSKLTDVPDLIAELRPGTVLHDWAASDPNQAITLQQKLSKIAEYTDVCRIIYAETVTPQHLAVAADCSVKRVLSYGKMMLNLTSDIKMAAAANKNQSELQQIIQKAQSGESYAQADIDEAVDKAFKQFAHDPTVKLEYGNLCLRKGEIEASRDIAQKLLTEQPQNVRAMNLLGRSLMKTGDFNGATAVLEKANGLSPFNTDRLLMLGEAFFKSGNNAKAKECYNQVAGLDPDSQEAQKGLTEVALSEGDMNAALDLIRNSASEEEAASLFNNAAVQAAKKGSLDESMKLYETALSALRTDKFKSIVYYNMALTYERQGNVKEALTYVNLSLKIQPDFAKAQRHKARLEAGPAQKKPA